MPDGILQHRLPEQRGDRRLEGIGPQIPDDLETILKAHLLDLDVHPQKIDLLAQRHDLMPGMVEREAEEAPQPRDHLIRRIGFRVNQLGDCVQGIEQKVGLQLHLQYLKVSPRESGFQLRSVEVAGAVQPEIVRRLAQRHEDEIGQQAEFEPLMEKARPGIAVVQGHGQEPLQGGGQPNESSADDRMDAGALQPPSRCEGGTPGQPEGDGRQRGPDPRPSERKREKTHRGK